MEQEFQIQEYDIVQEIKVIIIHGNEQISEILEEVIDMYKNGNKDN